MHKRKLKKPIKIIIIIILLLIIILGITYIVVELTNANKDKNTYQDVSNIFHDIEQKEDIHEQRINKLKELHESYENVIAWLEIEGTDINYPIVQTTDNDYYLNHNYKNEKSSAGAIYFDKDVKINESDNLQIYGHRNKYGLMFEPLIKYAKKDFYEEHKTINLTTLEEDATYEILAIFYSRVYYSNETNVFRYYYFVNAESEEEYNKFVNNAKKASKFDTGVDAKYGDKLITLSTCEYSRENGRFVVVAKKID